MRSFRLFLFASLVVADACVGRSAPRATPRAPAPAPTTAGPNLTGPWPVAAAYATQGVRIATRAVVTISGDPATRTDTLSAALTATYVTARTGRRRIDGSLVDFRVSVGSAPEIVPAGLQLTRAFTAEASAAGGALGFRVPTESSACTDPALSTLQALHEAWIPLPDTLRIGREWSDTVQTVSCRDRLPLHGTNVRRFRAQRAEVQDGRIVALIERRAKGLVTGEGDQFGERVQLTGESSGTVTYVLDVGSGRLLRASGTSVLEMAFKSSRRDQRVKQSSELTLVWKP